MNSSSEEGGLENLTQVDGGVGGKGGVGLKMTSLF